MSNKTSFKRIALAVVVALGFGVLSTGPTQAVVNSDSLTLSASTATATIGQSSDSASAATVTLSFLATSPTDSMSLTASLVSSPSTNTQLPELQLVDTTAAIAYKVPVGGPTGHMVLASAEAGANSNSGAARLNSTAVQTNFFGSRVASNDPVYVAAKDRSISSATIVSAVFKVYIPTPAVAGTYVVRLTPAITGNSGSTTIQSTYKDLTITVSAAACVRGCSAATSGASWSSMYYGASTRGVTLADLTSAQNPGDSVINFTMAMTNGVTNVQAANILVYQQNADADIVYTGGSTSTASVSASNSGGVESMTATISGPGLLGAGDISQAATGRNIIVQAGQFISVWNDGTSGVATITITGNTSGIVYGTKTVNFYGTATTVTVTASTTTVVNSGNLNYRYVSAVAKDANGIVNPVATNTLRLTSSDTNLMNVRMLAPDSTASTTFSSTGGSSRPGAYVAYWNFSTAADVTRLSTTKNGEFSFTIGTGGKTPVVGSLTSATTTIDSAAAVTVRLSNGIGGATLAFDKSSYRPGETAYLTLTATDSAGATAATATYGSLISTVEASGFGSGTPATGSHALVSGVKTFTFTMPNVETTAAIVLKGCTSATANNATCTDWTASATATVADPAVTAANAATAAANAATAAANAAKDAAVAAAAAAEAEAAKATAAAKAAQDAAVAEAAKATAAAKAAQDAAVAEAKKTADAAVAAADAAADAAAEAIDAANAATDAANLSAEAADAATVAAEEARDAADAATAAVEELATQVATLMAALKAQITTLANTVAKIAKKVKA